MQALIAQVDLARIDVVEADAGKPGAKPAAPVVLPAALLADVREQTARADREITDGYERQAVITAAAYLLEHAGLGAESDALLKANLAKSHSPYYLMSELASNAKKRGDKAEALRWYREAFEKSEGPATRLQWGASYVTALVDLAPADEAAIEADHRAALERGRGAARRVLRAQRALAAEGRRASCRPGTRAARIAPRWPACRASSTPCAPRRRTARASARPARRCSRRRPSRAPERRARRAASFVASPGSPR